MQAASWLKFLRLRYKYKVKQETLGMIRIKPVRGWKLFSDARDDRQLA